MNSEISTLLTNLALELNTALRKVKSLQAQIQEINQIVSENGLRGEFLDLAKAHQCLEILSQEGLMTRSYNV